MKLRFTGAVMLGTSHSDMTGRKARMSVVGSQLDVDGVVTIFGNRTEVTFAGDSAVSISGALQIGSPESLNHNDVKLDFDGDIELSYNEDHIQAAVESLQPLEVSWDLPELGQVLDMEMVNLSWREATP